MEQIGTTGGLRSKAKDRQKTPKHITELKYRIIAVFKDSIDKLNNRKKEKQNRGKREKISTKSEDRTEEITQVNKQTANKTGQGEPEKPMGEDEHQQSPPITLSALQSKGDSEAEFRIQKTVPKNVQIWQTETHKRQNQPQIRKIQKYKSKQNTFTFQKKQDKRRILRTTREK